MIEKPLYQIHDMWEKFLEFLVQKIFIFGPKKQDKQGVLL
jgi:hypothetical protein